MYHGDKIPGFPQHPHRGFETVTVVRHGYVDHSDSLGATARYGEGDVQWLTTGSGIMHAEMFPLIHSDAPNTMELFQIWLNLPPESKMVPAYFGMLWSEEIPTVEFDGGVTVDVMAGRLADQSAPAAPPDSWASRPESDLAIWLIKLPAGTAWTLPAAVGRRQPDALLLRRVGRHGGRHRGAGGRGGPARPRGSRRDRRRRRARPSSSCCRAARSMPRSFRWARSS